MFVVASRRVLGMASPAVLRRWPRAPCAYEGNAFHCSAGLILFFFYYFNWCYASFSCGLCASSCFLFFFLRVASALRCRCSLACVLSSLPPAVGFQPALPVLFVFHVFKSSSEGATRQMVSQSSRASPVLTDVRVAGLRYGALRMQPHRCMRWRYFNQSQPRAERLCSATQCVFGRS